MVIGVYCEQRRQGITFEECQECAKCLPAIVIKTLRKTDFTKERNSYAVGEVIDCLRKAYYERKEPLPTQYFTLSTLLSMKRGKLFEGLLDSTRWQELDGTLPVNVDGEPVKLQGRIDAYDPDKKQIIELKSTKIFEDTELPREQNVLQLQCYGTIFKKHVFDVNELTLLYVDMDAFETYSVPLVDKSAWLEGRVKILHRAVRDSVSPPEEPSYKCQNCPCRSKCTAQKPVPLSTHS